MSQFDQLREQIDACRPGSGDLSLSAMAELADAIERDAAVARALTRAQQFDRGMSAALHDVPIPDGLLERLLTACGRATLDEMVLPPTTAEAVTLPAPRTRASISRRWLVACGSAAALALVLGFTLFQAARPQRVVKESDLGEAVDSWNSWLTAQPSWQPLTGGVYPQGIPADGAVKATPQQWQELSFTSKNGWSATVAALDIAPRGRPRALLFVVQSSATFDVPTMPPPSSRLNPSGGLKAIAWRRESSRFLYVLAVEESPVQTLSDYLQRQPVASQLPRARGRSS